MTDPADLLVWPDTVTAFYADRGYSLRSAATRTTWGYTYRKLQRLHPGKPVGGFMTDDLVAFVTQRGWDTPRWSPATARNYRVAMQSLFGWAHHAERIPIDPASRLGQVVRIDARASGNRTGSPKRISLRSCAPRLATTCRRNATAHC